MTFRKVTPATKLVNEKKLSQAQMTPWHVPSSIWVHLGPRGSIFLVKNQFSHIFPASAWSPFLSVILTDKLARLACTQVVTNIMITWPRASAAFYNTCTSTWTCTAMKSSFSCTTLYSCEPSILLVPCKWFINPCIGDLEIRPATCLPCHNRCHQYDDDHHHHIITMIVMMIMMVTSHPIWRSPLNPN